MSTRPEELLAAYADGGLTDQERAEVDRFLAEHPERRQEVDELRALLTRARAHARVEMTASEPASEPDWSAMAAKIHRACDQLEAARQQRWSTRARAWLGGLLAPRPVIGLGAAAALAVLLLVLRSWPDDSTSRARDASQDRRDRTGSTVEIANGPGEDLDMPGMLDPAIGPAIDPAIDPALGPSLDEVLAALDEHQLDELLGTLQTSRSTRAAQAPASDALEQDTEEPGLLLDDEQAMAGWVDDEVVYGEGSSPGAFPDPDYEDWLDSLSEAEIDELDRYLAEVQAG